MNGLTQKEAAAACGVSVRQFIRYRHRYQWLEPVALTGLVPVFEQQSIDRLRRQVQADKLAVIEAIRQRMQRSRSKASAAKVVSMQRLRAEKGRAR